MSRARTCKSKNRWFDNGATSDCARARSSVKVSEVPCSRMSRIKLSACQNDSVPVFLVTASVAARWSSARCELRPRRALEAPLQDRRFRPLRRVLQIFRILPLPFTVLRGVCLSLAEERVPLSWCADASWNTEAYWIRDTVKCLHASSQISGRVTVASYAVVVQSIKRGPSAGSRKSADEHLKTRRNHGHASGVYVPYSHRQHMGSN